MCYSADARPPSTPPTDDVIAGPLTLTAADGAAFAAYAARPRSGGDAPGVLLLPDNLGLRRFYADLARELAGQGHPAVAIDYYGRSDGVTRDRPDGFDVMPHLAKLTRDGLFADFDAGIRYLREEVGCATVASLGFCLGGRFAFQTAAGRFGLAGAVGFYGATFPINGAPGPTQLAATFTAPILGIFGGADEGIPPSEVDGFDAALTAAGVPHEIVTYPGAPHGFFDASSEGHEDACADAWRRTLTFLTTTPRPPSLAILD